MGRIAGRIAAWAAGLSVLSVAGTAVAGPRVLLGAVYGEPDVADEAGAFGLLVLTAIDNGQGIAGPVPAGAGKVTMDRAPAILASAGAELMILANVDRLGPMLIATAQVLDRSGVVVGKFAGTASDGAVTDLAAAVVTELGPVLGLTPPRPPDFSVGQLRPFARAEQLRGLGRADDAARVLAGANAVVVLRLPPAAATARWIWTNSKDPAARLIAIGVGATPREVGELTAGNESPAARSLRALTQVGLSDAAAANAEIRGLTGRATALARAAIAQLRQDRTARDAAITELLAADAIELKALAWLARLAPGVLPRELEVQVVAAAAKSGDRRLAAALGLRAVEANVSVDQALALIAVNELDRGERARLRQILPKHTGTEPIRLAAEQALADGDLAAAKAALGKLRRVTDPRAALYRGRIAWALGDLDTASIDLETATAGPELARVLLAKGDAKAASLALGDAPASRVAMVAKAELAREEGRHADAVALLHDAEALSPGDGAVQLRLADALELSGDKVAAEKVRSRATGLALAPVPPEQQAREPAPGAGSADEPGPVAKEPAPSAAQAKMRTDLRDLLRRFQPAALYNRTFVIASIGAAPSPWAIREIDPRPMMQQLRKALEEPPILSHVVTESAERFPSRPTATALGELATRNGAMCALLYDVDLDGALRFVLYDTATGEAFETRGSVDVDALGMVGWNLRWLALPIGIMAVIALLGVLLMVRGSGVLEVRVALDPSGTNEVLCLEVQRSDRRWLIRDLEAFRATTREAGAKVGRRTARLVGGMTKFKVPPGHWYVHCYGVYDRPGSIRLLDETNTAQVDLRRGGSEVVEIDLVPTNAELRVTVLDDNPRGVTMWIDELPQRYYTDGKGEAVILCPVGDHTLHLDAKGLRLSRKVAFPAPTVELVEINLAVERQLSTPAPGATGSRKRSMSDQSISFRSSNAGFDMGALEREKLAAEAQAAIEGGGDGGDAMAAIVAAGGAAGPRATLSKGSRGGAASTPPPRSGAPSGSGVKADPNLLAGRYRIVKTLGKGAMGVVYRAHDENLEREVAVKALASELRHHPEALRFFIEEAKALAQLNHPNIVSVYDQTSDGTDTYLIMEFVDGRTLESLLEEKHKLAPQTALALIDQLCAGLAYVHARRVIHRDIKPANIFVSRERVVKLGDFGLARVMRELSIRKTEIRGTPLYMAPEQITGENVTSRADLYAVGCTLFELLTGRPPFTDGEILYHHIHTKPPKPSDFEPSLSPELDALVMDCIVKDATKRIETANLIRERIRGMNPTRTVR